MILKIEGKKVDGEVQQAVDYLDLGLKREDRTKDRHLGVFLHKNIILYHCVVCLLFLCTCLVLHNRL